MSLTLLLAASIVAVASCLQGTVGIGLGMVASPLLLLIRPELVPAPLLMANCLLAVMMALRERRAMNGRAVLFAVTGRVPGTLVGGLLVTVLAAAALDIVLGSLLLSCVVLAALRSTALPRTPHNLITAGFVSGISGTAVSVGGPPIAIVVRDLEGRGLRGTLSAFFLFGTTMSLATLALYGQLGRQELVGFLWLGPAVILGWLISIPLTGRIETDGARRAILWLSGISSALVLLRGVARVLT